MIAGAVLRTLAPAVLLPGEDFYPLALGLVPIAFALAALRRRPDPAAPLAAAAPVQTIDLV